MDVLWGKSNLNKPFSYNQLQQYINNGSSIDHSINGTISLGKVLGNGFTLIKDENNIFKEIHKDFPNFSIEIVEKDGEVIPSNTGLISTNHPLWNIQFGKGKGLIKLNKDDDLRPYYWAIINEVNRIMDETIKLLPKDHFMMWLTDCVYFKKESKNIIETYFNSIGYEYKENTCLITGVERNRVFWVNNKTGEEKYIFYSQSTCI